MDTRYLELLTMGPFESKEAAHEAKLAELVLPIRRKTNFLLSTILLWTVMSNTLVAEYFGEILGGLVGFFVSLFLIVICGEIIPQAICQKFGLRFAAKARFILYAEMIATGIIAFPISAMLDKMLGAEDGFVLTKSRMKKMFGMYEKENLIKPSESI